MCIEGTRSEEGSLEEGRKEKSKGVREGEWMSLGIWCV